MVEASNREEGNRCLEIARSALAAGDFSKAQRFADKAARLHPGLAAQVQTLLKDIERVQRSGQASSSGAARNGMPSGMSGAGLHNRGDSTARANGSAASQNAGTPEQRQLVRKIIATKDYYEMLSVEKGANEDELKRGYKKLALKLHPDKNQAAGAVEAFKAVSRAYACLSDPDKRANYDRYGHEDPGQQLGRRSRGGAGVYAQDQFDPDEIFNMFFGGGGFGPRTRVYTNFGPRAQRGGQPAAPVNPWAQLLHILPILLLVAFTFFSTQSEPAVSLDRKGAYTERYVTQRYSVPFFAKGGGDFQQKYPLGSGSRVRLEQGIEVEHKDRLEHLCHRERVEQARMARWGNRERARGMRLPHCEEIYEKFGYRYAPGVY